MRFLDFRNCSYRGHFVYRVNWEAKSDYEFVQNYKLLQVAFTKHGVQRHVDVDKLIRAKYQDNLVCAHFFLFLIYYV
jgi:microtubule-associated protein, RP/EB family